MDWIATAVTVLSSFLLAKKRQAGWIFSGIACLLWMGYGIWVVNSIPIVILNIILLTNSYRGFHNWKKGEIL